MGSDRHRPRRPRLKVSRSYLKSSATLPTGVTFEPADDSDFDPFDAVARCENCGGPIEVSNYYIYLGEPYHRRCLPDESKGAATEVPNDGGK